MRMFAVVTCLALGWLSLVVASRLEQLPLVLRRISRTPSTPTLTYSLPSFDYGKSTVRGVNLGGWLVLEPWMTPSLFSVPGSRGARDEWTLSENLGRPAATALLRHHWSTFISEDDFAKIASHGLNHVRMSIGYWAWDISYGEPYVQGQLEYLQQGVLWAAKYGLRVMIDLHGAPGSQNGFDNSGHSGGMTWHLNQQDNIERTKACVSQLVMEFSKPKYSGAVTMIEPLNEPAAFVDQDIVPVYQKYLHDAYRLIRYPIDPKIPSSMVVSFHDAFLGPRQWTTFWPKIKFPNTLLDIHPYTVFSDAMTEWNTTQRIGWVCRQRNAYASSRLLHTTVAGEWSPAVTDCAKFLNGVDEGARYDGTFPGSSYVGSCSAKTGDASTFSRSYINELRRYWEAQTRVYGGYGDGWMMWTWKTEPGVAEDWSYMKGLQYGWIPKDARTMKFPDPCK